MIDASDVERLRSEGRDPDAVRHQLALLAGPPPRTRLLRPCTVGDGIEHVDPARHLALEAAWARAAAEGRLTLMVPASGAASRMVGSLVEAVAARGAPPEPWPALLAAAERLALWPALRAAGAVPGDVGSVLVALVGEGGLELQHTPKALVPFHRAGSGVRTAFEEHVVDAGLLVRDAEGRARLHLTVGAEHRAAFEAAAREVSEVEITFSEQSPATDTAALGEDGRPVRDAAGRLVLRPGGHGSLLRNVEGTGADLLLLRNVDNVVPDALRADVLPWRRRLVGRLVEVQDAAHAHLRALREGHGAQAAADFVRATLGEDLAPVPSLLIDRLDRPWRVAGMVRNEGQPGGGPFFVEGHGAPQIVEQVQVAGDDPDQAALLRASTHFNPVELVLGLRDADGEPYALDAFADPSAVLVTTKTMDGRRVRVLEHPGLWNGGMARWNTVLVEIPAVTFQPVKTLLDLARVAHGGWLP